MTNAVATTPKKPELSERERRVLELVVLRGIKPTEAVRTIYPESKRPDVMASKMFAKPHVQEERARMDSDALATAGVTRSMIVNELRRIGFSSLYGPDGKPKDIDQLDEDTRAAVGSLETELVIRDVPQLNLFDGEITPPGTVRVRKIKLWDKPKALTELATIAKLKDTEILGDRLGPGLTVIVQQAVQNNGTAEKTVQTHRVDVRLPGPPR